MDERGRLTPDDGDVYTQYCERWGETPQGQKLRSCSGCGRCLGHSDNCTGRTHQSYEEMLWEKFMKIVR